MKDCKFRIYRYVRFSKDKSPYNTHMGAYICSGGKKSGFSGYYFHLEVGGQGYLDGHMLAMDDYCCEPKVLKMLREDILDNGANFQTLMDDAAKYGFVLDDTWKQKNVPKGFDKEPLWVDYLRCMVY